MAPQGDCQGPARVLTLVSSAAAERRAGNAMSQGKSRIVITGLTNEGRRFRPSDWAQRITTAVGSAGADRRVRFHPRVSMAMREGVNCVVVDMRLEEEDPMMFEFLMNFARSNDLQIAEE